MCLLPRPGPGLARAWPWAKLATWPRDWARSKILGLPGLLPGTSRGPIPGFGPGIIRGSNPGTGPGLGAWVTSLTLVLGLALALGPGLGLALARGVQGPGPGPGPGQAQRQARARAKPQARRKVSPEKLEKSEKKLNSAEKT